MRRARDVEPPEAAIVDVPKLFLAPSLTSTSALPSDLPELGRAVDLKDFRMEELPEELIGLILFFLPPAEIMKFETVSKNWCRLLRQNDLWRSKFNSLFSEPGKLSKPFYTYLSQQNESWKTLFRQTRDFFKERDREINNLVDSNDLDSLPSLKTKSVALFSAVRKYNLTDPGRYFQLTALDHLHFGAFYKIFETIVIRRLQDGKVEIEGISEGANIADQIQFVFDMALGPSIVLVTGNTFATALHLRAKLAHALMETMESARSFGCNLNSQDEFSLLSSACMFFDGSNPKEAAKRDAMQARTMEILGEFEDTNRSKYYNMSCCLAKFGQFEESKKWLMWTFNYVDGKYKEEFFSPFQPSTKQLLDAALGDSYFDEAREMPWFKEAIEFAKAKLAEEAAEGQ